MSDASEMLAAALEQMDGIIAGKPRAAAAAALSGRGPSQTGHIWKLLSVAVGILRPNNAALFILPLLILRLQTVVWHSLLWDVSGPPLVHFEGEGESFHGVAATGCSVMETNDYSAVRSLTGSWLHSLDFSPFSADVSNYSVDLSSGSEGYWRVT